MVLKGFNNMERYIVDRVKDGIAVLEKEDLTHIEIIVSEIGYEVKEGNVLLFENGKFTLDEAFEVERRRKIFEKQKIIFKNK